MRPMQDGGVAQSGCTSAPPGTGLALTLGEAWSPRPGGHSALTLPVDNSF